MGQSKAYKLGRDSRTGEFVSVKKARQHPSTCHVEHIPKRQQTNVFRTKRK